MQWRGRRGSSNVEDRRGQTPSRGGFGAPGGFGRRPGGFPGGFPGSGSGRGVSLPRSKAGWVIFLIFVGVSLFAGSQYEGGAPTSSSGPLTQTDRDRGQFASVVLADTEEVWAEAFETELGRRYDPPRLVLFSGAVQSACGGASAASGPFYCPLDETAYLDTDFFDALDRRLGAGGDFAAAYVIAHEVGHHVENELGVLERAQRMKAGLGQAEANAVQVKVELMADCLAGVWAQKAQAKFGSLDEGDVDEALNAASRIGDDTLQREAGRSVRPESFQHGTSQQRRSWFARGWNEGAIAACDTFGGAL